jgi:hypothetical protein
MRHVRHIAENIESDGTFKKAERPKRQPVPEFVNQLLEHFARLFMKYYFHTMLRETKET